ncbi:MAG: sodium/proton antiporter NhaB [Pseudomonadota bacterium]
MTGHPTSGTAPDRWLPALFASFLGQSPDWYKWTILGFLLLNPLALALAGPFFTGWLLLAEFIFTLALALKCYPLQPGGLLALEGILLGMAGPDAVYAEITANFPVILLLIFMVAGIHFLRDLLLYVFSIILMRVQSRIALALLFSLSSAILSAFLDALTVVAVVITVAAGLYAVYHAAASTQADLDADGTPDLAHEDLEKFRAFLRGLLMHAAVGTALGGVSTLVGEPQNLLIGTVAGWNFAEFFLHTLPVSGPVLVAGLLTCAALEKLRWFGYGAELPPSVRDVMRRHFAAEAARRTRHDKLQLVLQALTALFLFVGLAFHLAEVGLIGLAVIVLATALCGITEEKRLGHAFEEALPFTALLVVFFAIVAVIHEQHLFQPVIAYVLQQEDSLRLPLMYSVNGLLSAISDNVFVATVYISEIKAAFDAGALTREQFELLAVAVNTGTNIPSVATPNGQAAFLFLLTSSIAPLIRLGYSRMAWMALPYTVTLTLTGLVAIAQLA